ncbi:hypothetical protein ACTXT7_010461 [Hymenolepis weldensis]
MCVHHDSWRGLHIEKDKHASFDVNSNDENPDPRYVERDFRNIKQVISLPFHLTPPISPMDLCCGEWKND